MRRATIAALAFCALAPAPAGAAAGTIHLPTEADASTLSAGAESILYGPNGIETRLPGPTSDRERVEVAVPLDGPPASVVVTQILRITGLGDYFFKVQGPAADVEGIGASSAQPGLRKGAVLWQGFSSGSKVLKARMKMFPDQEAERLPVAIEAHLEVGGAPVDGTQPSDGPFVLTLKLRNTTPSPIGVATGRADPRTVASLLDALHSSLARGRRPAPGSGGFPAALPASHTRFAPEPIEAPFRVKGTVTFPAGTVTDGSTVEVNELLGGGAPLESTVTVTGRATGLKLPDIDLTATPALPRPDVVAPPHGSSWEGETPTAPLVKLAVETLWKAARLRQYDGYLGNPDPTGAARTTYHYTIEAPQASVAGGPKHLEQGFGVLMIALSLIALLLLLFNSYALWSLS